MEDYAKLYHLLFNAITDALEQMNAQNFGERSNAAPAGSLPPFSCHTRLTIVRRG